MLRHLLIGFMLVLSATIAFASDDPETPQTFTGGKIISVDEAKGLIGKAKFFDMRKAISFGKGHVPGAVALPYDQKSEKAENFDATKDKFDLAQLPSNKADPIVFYSDGPTGWKSYKAAVIAVRNGYTNVMWMRGGTKDWEQKNFPIEQ